MLLFWITFGFMGLFGFRPQATGMDEIIARNPRQPDLIYIGGHGSAAEWPGLTIYFDMHQRYVRTALGIAPTIDQLKAQLK